MLRKQPFPVAGFTLIELLIVVAIIAILAAIAVPNFMEAQVRAKVSRALADLRTVSTAAESYAVDNRRYPPNDGYFNIIPVQLTTPIAYLSSIELKDPFSNHAFDEIGGELIQYYTYGYILSYQEFMDHIRSGGPVLPLELVDFPGGNPGALFKYGKYRLVSNGPDRAYRDPDYTAGADPTDTNNVLLGADIRYDATNGTKSKGNIIFTQSGGPRQ